MSVLQGTQQGPGAQGPGRDNAGSGVSKNAISLMWFETATLAVVSSLHLAGVIGNGTKVNPSAAGIAEAVIAAVLAAAAVVAQRMPGQARPVAVGALCFAILGFGFGLSITARGGDAVDIGYHAIMLPLLIVTLILLLGPRRRRAG